MAKRKIAELTTSLPSNGQYDIKETGISGKKYVGLPTYDYAALADDLEDGYDGVTHDKIIVETGTNRVLNGSHRVYAMINTMDLAANSNFPDGDQTEIDVDEMSKKAYGKMMVESVLEPGDIANIPNRQKGWTPTKWIDEHIAEHGDPR